ncbi:MAG TPA: DNA recombination protein RmuC [Acidimicrobiales bacterium]|nr:DNA recombination protein RmuC [Acidimicrobiales bacterium]
MITGLVVGLVAGVAVGGAVVLVVSSGRLARRVSTLHAQHAAASSSADAELVRLRSLLDQERVTAAERQATHEEARELAAGVFAELSTKALEQNNAQFLALAEARLQEARQAAQGDLDHRRQAIEQLLTPLADQLGRYEQGLRLLELERQRAYTGLSAQVTQLAESQEKLQSETRNLVTALRSPATRGRWGEMQLRRVVEMAGMLEHCDFEEQVHTEGEEGRLRPDMVVHLPGTKRVVVDAKVPMQAFLDATDATDDTSRKAHLVSHARQLRAHVDALSKKSYWQQFADSPEFVIAFIPGDPLLAAALEHDSALLEHAVANHVLLATPTTLIGLLRAVAYGWQQDALAENAREVQQIGRELYKRLATFGEHMARTGRSLSGAVDAYNKAVGSLERNVMPQARRFQELGVGGSDKEVPILDQVDAVARRLQTVESTGSVLPLVEKTPGLELVEGSGDERPELPGAAEG